jgi:hypothetical protein
MQSQAGCIGDGEESGAREWSDSGDEPIAGLDRLSLLKTEY